MKSKWWTGLAVASITLGNTDLSAWGHPKYSYEPVAEPSLFTSQDNFPLNPDQAWYTQETYLLMRVTMDNLDYGDRLTVLGSVDTQIDEKLKVKKPEFEWSSGVRLGIGRYLPHHDLWDISVWSTYLYSEAESKASPSREKGSIVTSLWTPDFRGFSDGDTHWHLNLFTFDLLAGRRYTLTPRILAHPYIGLRSGLFYQEDLCRYSSQTFIEAAGFTRANNFKFHGYDSYWGIGPRLGVDFSYYLRYNLHILGNFSATLLFGQDHIQENIREQSTSSPNNPTLTTFRVKDHGFAIRPNLEGSLGLGWETWYKKGAVRIAPSILFEASEWFDMNQWLTIIPLRKLLDSPIIPFDYIRRHGDLGVIGLSFNLQVDF